MSINVRKSESLQRTQYTTPFMFEQLSITILIIKKFNSIHY